MGSKQDDYCFCFLEVSEICVRDYFQVEFMKIPMPTISKLKHLKAKKKLKDWEGKNVQSAFNNLKIKILLNKQNVSIFIMRVVLRHGLWRNKNALSAETHSKEVV